MFTVKPLIVLVSRCTVMAAMTTLFALCLPLDAYAQNETTQGETASLSGNVTHEKHAHGGASKAPLKTATLDSGPLLLVPTANEIVETPFGSVGVGRGSVVLIIVTDKELAVYNLHDAHTDAVVVRVKEKDITLLPERVVFVAKDSLKTFEEANPAPFVAYRQVRKQKQADDMLLYQAEFNFESMARGLPQLSKLMTEHKTMGDMLKTAAIMTQLSQGSSEPYGYYVTDRVRALSAGQKP